MDTKLGTTCCRQKGFSLFELVVVISLISILGVVALDRYYKLLVDVERTTMEYNLGVMRSAISMQFAKYFVTGDRKGIESLINSNPMQLLAERPGNYLGEKNGFQIEEIEKGNWFYDRTTNNLIYLVRNQLYFESNMEDFSGARFKIFPVYSDKQSKGKPGQYLSGLRLTSLEEYYWKNPWD